MIVLFPLVLVLSFLYKSYLFISSLYLMNFLTTYLRPYRKLLILVLVLAAINQIFSLLDPQVMRWIMDNYLTQPDKWTTTEYIHGIILGVV